MGKTVKTIERLPKLEKKIRVAAYARVSTYKDAMLLSLANQISYYKNYITSHEGWEFAGVFADDITGTKDTREEFVKLVNECKAGKIDLILTKSISRFARNTLTTLQTIKDLKEIGVNVYFEEQKVYSLSPEGEMVITFLASFAQEEARSMSMNMKTRIKHDFEDGVIWGGADNYGYRLDREGKNYMVVPEQAEVVKRIFELYVSGIGYQGIANILNKEGIKPMYAKEWGKTNISLILGNSNYTGNLILQKTYRKDYLTKRMVINKGEHPKYMVEDNHEPIISKELFEKAQELRKERAEKYKLRQSTELMTYPFTGLIKCSCCGKSYQHKITGYNKVWICRTFNTQGKAYCQSSKQIDEGKLYEAINEFFGWDCFKENEFKDKVKKIVAKSNNELELHLKGGNVVSIFWKDRSRSESWTPEMKEKARKQAQEQNTKRGGNRRWQK